VKKLKKSKGVGPVAKQKGEGLQAFPKGLWRGGRQFAQDVLADVVAELGRLFPGVEDAVFPEQSIQKPAAHVCLSASEAAGFTVCADVKKGLVDKPSVVTGFE
jgi:hypothetical protein